MQSYQNHNNFIKKKKRKKIHPKIYIKSHGTMNSQTVLKKNKLKCNILPDFKSCDKAIVIKILKTERTKYTQRTKEQNKDHRNKSLHIWSNTFGQEHQDDLIGRGQSF